MERGYDAGKRRTMPNAFNFSASPFDCLDSAERQLVRDSVDIAYFRAGETVLDAAIEPSHLFVVIKGVVQQFDGSEAIASYGPDDCFDGRALMTGRVSSRFVAAEEVVAYELAKQAVSELIARNATFGALLFSDLSNKLHAIGQRQSRHEMQALTMARVDQAFLRPAFWVEGATDIVSIARLFKERRTSHVLVRDASREPPRRGIFTTVGLQQAILDGRPLDRLPVADIASFPLVTVRPGDPLFEALALMIRHQIHRVAVDDGGDIVGVLDQLDLLSFLSNHSYLITLQIAEAQDVDALKAAAERITGLVGLLYRGGTKVGLVARLVQALNAKLHERTWQLVAPPELVANSCLFVMGSEGRGEQLLKTDQDNGLVLRDGCDASQAAEACERYSAALREFGYPDCPGGIMASNRQWRQPASDFAAMVRRWLQVPDPEGLMALAIFLDASPVCGDASLLEGVRGEVDRLVSENDALLGRFAAAIESFPESGPGAWWNRLLSLGDAGTEKLNLKKAAIFPLVHGVRSLALAHHVRETSTARRLDALVAAGRLPANFAGDLLDSLHFFMGLRLQAGLDEIDAGRPVSGGIEPAKLSSLDRDLLKDTLAIVKRFKALLRNRFHLEYT